MRILSEAGDEPASLIWIRWGADHEQGQLLSHHEKDNRKAEGDEDDNAIKCRRRDQKTL